MVNVNIKEEMKMNFSEQDVSQNKVMGILAYLGILCLIPFLAAKESPYAQFHAKQGLNLFIIEAIYSVAFSILSVILAFIPIIGWIIIALLGLVSIVFLALAIMGIVSACGSEAKELPIVGKIKIVK